MTPPADKHDLTSNRVSVGEAIPASFGRVRRIDSQTLLGSANEILIEHEGSDYRLRLTRQGKLILTK
jgi:hemin uptake protein HemP